ncbi:MAG: fasciclin domain-containing protein [Lyngbya sp.]|nr:fasciclin domain-containing protein [Lyngbya sp.]
MTIFHRFQGFKSVAVVGIIAASTLIGLPEMVNAGGGPSRETSQSTQTQAAAGDIVETATSAGQFTILAQALEAAGLVEVLKGEGPYTVFAPTDEAFQALPEGTLEELLQPENKERLVAILTYHVVPGRVTSGELESGEVQTVQGSPVTVKVDSGVMVDEANVIKADVPASNGVIHVIDQVIIPE